MERDAFRDYNMEETVRELMFRAEKHHDYDLAGSVNYLLNNIAALAQSLHKDDCYPDWFDLPEILANEHNGDWLDENCRLHEFR